MPTSTPAAPAVVADCLITPTALAPELEAQIKRNGGATVPGIEFMACLPWAAEHLAYASAVPSILDERLKVLICYVVSQDNSCRYCYGMHRALLRFMGFRDREIDQIEHDVQGSRLSDRERAALDFARALSRSNPRPARGDLAALDAAGFTRREVMGIAQAASGMCASNRLATMLSIPPMLDLEDASRNPIKRFVGALTFKNMVKARRDPQLPPVPDGTVLPCQTVLDALSETAFGREFRYCMYKAWESGVLPKRVKGLIFAVVARALSCPNSEQDARRLLLAEGMAPEIIEEVLSTLDSAELSDLERDLVSFARDTVRYQSPAIQQRTREVADGRSQPEILEIVMIAALANCHTRLGCLLQVD